jgi:iron complex transport system substrate-binding protein
MKTRRARAFAVAALLPFLILTLGLAACGDGDESAPAAAQPGTGLPVTVERSDGREITIEEAPQRIVSLSPGATEILFAIGAGDSVVASDDYSDYPPETQETTKLDAFEPNLEAIVGVEGDLIIVAHNQDNVVEALDDLGEPVLYLVVPEDVAGVLEQIRLFGRITDHQDEAEELARSLEDRIDAIEAKLADVEQGPRVFHELDNTLFTAAPDSFIGDLYRLLKAENIAAGSDNPYPQLTQEAIIDRDPEVIILADAEFGESPETVKSRAGWDVISAVKNDRIHSIDPDIVSRPGPRVVDALEELARLLYPERF